MDCFSTSANHPFGEDEPTTSSVVYKSGLGSENDFDAKMAYKLREKEMAEAEVSELPGAAEVAKDGDHSGVDNAFQKSAAEPVGEENLDAVGVGATTAVTDVPDTLERKPLEEIDVEATDSGTDDKFDADSFGDSGIEMEKFSPVLETEGAGDVKAKVSTPRKCVLYSMWSPARYFPTVDSGVRNMVFFFFFHQQKMEPDEVGVEASNADMELSPSALSFYCVCCSKQKKLSISQKRGHCKHSDDSVRAAFRTKDAQPDALRTLRTVIAAIFKMCVREGWYDDCEGCEIGDPSQMHHDCLMMGEDYHQRVVRRLCCKLDHDKIMQAVHDVYRVKEADLPPGALKCLVKLLKVIRKSRVPSEMVEGLYAAGDESTRFIINHQLRKQCYRKYFKPQHRFAGVKVEEILF